MDSRLRGNDGRGRDDGLRPFLSPWGLSPYAMSMMMLR